MDIGAVEAELKISNTGWHDGRLLTLTYVTSDETTYVALSVEIYEHDQSVERHRLSIRFVGVQDYTYVGTSAELQNHYRAGHIIQARFNANRRGLLDLSVYLTGGYIRIVSEGVSVVREGQSF